MASHLERLVYLNGDYMRGGEAQVSIFDRGLLFADAVYEGLGIRNGRIIDFEKHMARLRRSLGELNIPEPLTTDELQQVFATLIAENQISEGFLYLHITRGEADRDYVYQDNMRANIFAFVQPPEGGDENGKAKGVTMRSHPDLRWKRRDIKTSNLLGQVLAKHAAADAGDYEALLVDENGIVTEGGATSFFIVKDNQLLVRPLTNEILNGITRQSMLQVAADMDVEIVETTFTLQQAYEADESFLTGASSYIQPVVAIDGRKIGGGSPGRFTLALLQAYLKQCDSGGT